MFFRGAGGQTTSFVKTWSCLSGWFPSFSFTCSSWSCGGCCCFGCCRSDCAKRSMLFTTALPTRSLLPLVKRWMDSRSLLRLRFLTKSFTDDDADDMLPFFFFLWIDTNSGVVLYRHQIFLNFARQSPIEFSIVSTEYFTWESVQGLATLTPMIVWRAPNTVASLPLLGVPQSACASSTACRKQSHRMC